MWKYIIFLYSTDFLHSTAPVAGKFELESVNSAYIKARVNMVIRFNQNLLVAETCYKGDYRLWNISFVKVRGKDIEQISIF
jgi:hypothetical protein